MLNHRTIPASVVTELPLKLARKCVDALGAALFEAEGISHTINVKNEEEVASVCAGKEFGLLRTISGKVFILKFIQFFKLIFKLTGVLLWESCISWR